MDHLAGRDRDWIHQYWHEIIERAEGYDRVLAWSLSLDAAQECARLLSNQGYPVVIHETIISGVFNVYRQPMIKEA